MQLSLFLSLSSPGGTPLRDKQWTGLLASAATTKKGDTITIGYQGDQTIFDSFYLSKIVGFGSLTKK
ncbi:MAG: hypothetical protein ACJAT3_001604 [Akkermansiaceae bacterium]